MDTNIGTKLSKGMELQFKNLAWNLLLRVCMKYSNSNNKQIHQVTTTDEVLKLRQQGLSHKQIAIKLGFNRCTVSTFIRKNNIDKDIQWCKPEANTTSFKARIDNGEQGIVEEWLTTKVYPFIKKTKECWEWSEKTNTKGYGHVNGILNNPITLHKLMYAVNTNKLNKYGIPCISGFVLHKCDNKLCCNPAHLYEGTAKDNFEDMRERGQLSSVMSNQKLVSDVITIDEMKRLYYEEKLTQTEIGNKLGFKQVTVSAFMKKYNI